MKPVCSFNEWDPAEEIIVGRIDGAHVPEWQEILSETMPKEQHDFFRAHGGRAFPAELVTRASEQLDHLSELLRAQGIEVKRPGPIDWSKEFSTPHWRCASGLYSAMPRDCLIVVGETIIEAPMSWRSRYFETFPYRSILSGYLREGARWIAAPKPQLTGESYASAAGASAVTEFEPLFDAADFMRFGRDLIAQESHVTNRLGIRWLQNAIGPEFRVHVLKLNDPHPMHIDASIVPLSSRVLLVNPERVPEVPELFRSWKVIPAPPPVEFDHPPLFMSSSWLSMNVLSLDEKRVLVEPRQVPLMKLLKEHGFEVIPCPLEFVNSFGGSFHCVTLDVRRRGELRSYL